MIINGVHQKRRRMQSLEERINKDKKIKVIAEPYILQNQKLDRQNTTPCVRLIQSISLRQKKERRKTLNINIESLASVDQPIQSYSLNVKHIKTQKRCPSLQKYYDSSNFLEKNIIIPKNHSKYHKIIESYQNISSITNMTSSIDINSFIDELSLINPLFKRLKNVTKHVFIRFTKIKTLNPQEYLYLQGEKQQFAYIILWGEFIIKKIHFPKKSIYVREGWSLCEEVIIKNFSIKSKQSEFKNRAQSINKESAKSLTDSAVLLLDQRIYKHIKKQLTLFGLKNDTLILQSFLRRSFINKNTE